VYINCGATCKAMNTLGAQPAQWPIWYGINYPGSQPWIKTNQYSVPTYQILTVDNNKLTVDVYALDTVNATNNGGTVNVTAHQKIDSVTLTKSDSVQVMEINESTVASVGASTNLTTIKPFNGETYSVETPNLPTTYWVPLFVNNVGIDLTTKLNIKGDASNLGVRFNLYVGDADSLEAINTGYVQPLVGSSEDGGSNYFVTQVNIKELDIKVGWNDIELNVNEAWKSGSPQLTNIKSVFLRLDGFKHVGAHLAVNNVRLTKISPTDGNSVHSSSYGEFLDQSKFFTPTASNVQAVNYKGVSEITTELTNSKSSIGSENSVKVTSSATAVDIGFIADDIFNPISEMAINYKATDLGIAFWINIADNETLMSMMAGKLLIGVGSGTTVDTNHYMSEMSFSNYPLSLGWNEIVMKVSDIWTAGTTNISKIEHVRFYLYETTAVAKTFEINDLRIIKINGDTNLSYCRINRVEMESVGVIENQMNYYTITQNSISGSSLPIGGSSVLSQTNPVGASGYSAQMTASVGYWVTFYRRAIGVDPASIIGVSTDYDDFGIAFWMYIPDQATLDTIVAGGESRFVIAAGSDDGDDTANYNNVSSMKPLLTGENLDIGWNEFVIKVSTDSKDFMGSPSTNRDAPDYSNFRFIRLAIEGLGTNVGVRISDVRLVKTLQTNQVVINRVQETTKSTISVDVKDLDSVSVDEVAIGKVAILSATASNGNPVEYELIGESINRVDINSNGVVSGVSKGLLCIKFSAEGCLDEYFNFYVNGEKYDKVRVTVTENGGYDLYFNSISEALETSKTLTVLGSVTEAGFVTSEDVNITFTGGTYKISSPIQVNGGSLTITGGNIQADNSTAISMQNATALTLSNTSVKGKSAVEIKYTGENKTITNITNCVLEGTAKDGYALKSYADGDIASKGTVNITDTKLKSASDKDIFSQRNYDIHVSASSDIYTVSKSDTAQYIGINKLKEVSAEEEYVIKKGFIMGLAMCVTLLDDGTTMLTAKFTPTNNNATYYFDFIKEDQALRNTVEVTKLKKFENKDGNLCYIMSYGFELHELSDKLTFRLSAEVNGITYYSTINYGFIDYANNKIDGANRDALIERLQQGASAQQEKNYRVDVLATDILN